MFDFHLLCGAGCWGAGGALMAAAAMGLRGVALVRTCEDADFSSLGAFCASVRAMSLHAGVTAWGGVELANFPPGLLAEAVAEARRHGAQLVLARGEGLGGRVAAGTNLAAVEAGADILCDAGVLDREVAQLAAEKGVFVEFSACGRKGLANAHALKTCMDCGCAMVCGSSASCAGELPDARLWADILRGAAPDDPRAAAEYLRMGGETLMRSLLQGMEKKVLLRQK